MISQINLIESDDSFRAQLATWLCTLGLTAELFENPAEFEARHPEAGLVMVRDGQVSLSRLAEISSDWSPWYPVAVYDFERRTDRIFEAAYEGAVGYLVWPFDRRDFAQRLAKIQVRIDRMAASMEERLDAKRRVSILSARERQVLTAVSAGGSNKEIGRRLAISHRTVEIHRANMMGKLEAGSTGEAIRMAISSGLVSARAKDDSCASPEEHQVEGAPTKGSHKEQ